MDPSLSIEMQLKDNKVHTGFDALAAKEEKVDKGLSKIANAAKQAERELDRFAKRTTEINATPAERYNAQLVKLDHALKRGAISQETYNRAVARARTALEQATTVQAELVSSDALGNVGRMAAGYLSLSTAISFVGDAFRHAREESRDALSSLRSLDDARRKLVQQADSPEELQALLTRADRGAVDSGVDRAMAYDVLFQAESFGFSDRYEQILGANETIRADAAAKLAGKVPQMFGGKITSMESINMALAAGKPSEVDAETIAGALANALEGGRRVAATPDETFALVATLSAAFKSGDVAADRIKAFANRAASVPALRDKGIMSAFEAMKAMPEAERFEILKTDQETNAIYEALLEYAPQVREIEGQVRAARLGTGGPDDLLTRQNAIAAATRQNAASLMDRQSDLQLETAKENALAAMEARRKSGISRVLGIGYETGTGAMANFFGNRAGEVASFLGLSPAAAAAAAYGGQQTGRNALALASTVQGPGFFNIPQIVEIMRRSMQQDDKFHSEAIKVLKEIKLGTERNRGRVGAAEAKAPQN